MLGTPALAATIADQHNSGSVILVHELGTLIGLNLGERARTSDFLLPKQARYHCATPRRKRGPGTLRIPAALARREAGIQRWDSNPQALSLSAIEATPR